MSVTPSLKDKVEFTLDNRQIFFLFFGLSVVGCFVFAMGVMVGKRGELHELPGVAQAESSVLADDPQVAEADYNFSFKDGLQRVATDGLPATRDPSVAPRDEDPAAYAAAFEAADRVLAEGDLLGIFPEGGITRDGVLQPFKGGIMKILERRPVPVVPVALRNLWGSFFSRVERGTAMVRPFRRGLFSRVGLAAGPALAAAQVTPDGLRSRVAQLLVE